MTIREYAEAVGQKVSGNLKLVHLVCPIDNVSVYEDEAGTQYWYNRVVKSIVIIEPTLQFKQSCRRQPTT